MRHHSLTVEPRARDDADRPDYRAAASEVAKTVRQAIIDHSGIEVGESELTTALAEVAETGKLAIVGAPCDVVVRGDFHLFHWLSQAAGPAGAGFLGNNAETTDGSGHWLVLEPEQPERNQRTRSRLSHRELRA